MREGNLGTCRVRSSSSEISTTPCGSRSQTIRRADPATAVPALLEAIRHDDDSYGSFERSCCCTDSTHPTAVRSSRRRSTHPTTRARGGVRVLRAFPSTLVVAKLAIRLETEVSEFVRPYLVRAGGTARPAEHGAGRRGPRECDARVRGEAPSRRWPRPRTARNGPRSTARGVGVPASATRGFGAKPRLRMT